MAYASNWSPEEQLRMTGKFTDEQNEEFLRLGDTVDSLSQIDLREVGAGFPDEDFLSTVIRSVRNLAKKLRNDNRGKAMTIAETLEEMQTEIGHSTEYSREKLNAAIKLLDALP